MEVKVPGDPRPERTNERTSHRTTIGLETPESAREDAFARAIDDHRRDVVLLCYRFLGSMHEAEEAAQETALRAWRGRDSFRGDASLRTWLHRIASRVCLDALDRRAGRVLPPAIRAAADPFDPPDHRPNDIAWLEPLPEEFLGDAELDPAARYSIHESVSLAFLAALQALPTRQRAVLLLRDVLAWSASETADALDMTAGAASSLLHRARETLAAGHHRTGAWAMPSTWPTDPDVRRLLSAYVRAWESDDVEGLVATLKDEVRLAMPPSPSWYAGRGPVVEFVRRWVLPQGRSRLPLTSANGQPAVGVIRIGRDGSEKTLGIQVLTLDATGINDITAFMDPAIATRFGFG
jgi:RNA polymerase sigma-70 factor (ECF subfamily)